MAAWNVHRTNPNSHNAKVTHKDGQPQKKDSHSFRAGDVIQGIVTAVGTGSGAKVTLDFAGKSLKVDSGKISASYVGQVKTFQVQRSSAKGLVLKELNTDASDGQKMIGSAGVQTNRQAFFASVSQAQQSLDTGDEAGKTMDSNRRQFSENDAEQLDEEGFSLEKFNEERLQRALERMELAKELKELGIENQINQNKEYREQIIEQAIAIAVKNGVSEPFAVKLAGADLPATLENEWKLKEALSQAKSASNMSDGMKAFLVGLEQEPTIEQIYQSRYGGARQEGSYAADTANLEEEWNQVEEQAKERLSDAGYPVTGQTLEDAKWLFTHHLPISAEAMSRLAYVNDISGTDWTDGKIADQVVSHMASGGDALTTVLAGDGIGALAARRRLEEARLAMTLESHQKMAETGVEVDTDRIQMQIDQMREQERAYYESLLSEASCEMNEESVNLLKNTIETAADLGRMPEYVLGATYRERTVQTIDSLHEAGKPIRHQLDEAGERYETMMTVPRKDLGDSISKAFAHNDEILSGLGLEDTEANRRAVRILGYNQMEITTESVISMKNYDAKVQSVLRGLQPSVVAEMIKRGSNPLHESLDELATLADGIRNELGVSGEEKYANFLWKAQQDGTITSEERQAFIGIYRLLNQVEKSDGAAVGALVKSNRELTLSNLLSAVRSRKNAGMDVTVDDSFGELKSLTYRSMTITQQIESYYHDAFAGQEDQDQSQKIPAAQGHNSAAARGMAETVDEEEMEYVSQVLKNVLDSVTPALLKQAAEKCRTVDGNQTAGENRTAAGDGTGNPTPIESKAAAEERVWESLKNVSLEMLEEALKDGTDSAETEAAYRYQELEHYRTETKDCLDAVEMLRQYEIPSTFAFVTAAKQLIRNGKDWYGTLAGLDGDNPEGSLIEEQSDALIESLGEEDMGAHFRKFDENAGQVLRNALENPNNTVEEFESIRRMGARIQLGQKLREKNCIEIPYMDDGQVSLMRIQVKQGKGQSATIEIRRDSERYGLMDANLKVQDGRIEGYAFYDTRDGMDAAEEQIGAFREAVAGMGMELTQFRHAMAHTEAMNGNTDMPQNGQEQNQGMGQNDAVDLRTLFRVAKAFVLSMKGAQG